MKHRKTHTPRDTARRVAAVTAVAAAAPALTVGIVTVSPLATVGEPRAVGDTAAVTRIGPLPDGASVARAGRPAGQVLEQVKERQRRQAARAAREARQRQEAASRSASRTVSYDGDPRSIAASMASQSYGWGSGEFSCLDSLWVKESSWQVHASNPSSGAYGIPQALPGGRMSTYGADWRDNPVTQIQWGLAYIHQSYGTPCSAWATSQSQGWY